MSRFLKSDATDRGEALQAVVRAHSPLGLSRTPIVQGFTGPRTAIRPAVVLGSLGSLQSLRSTLEPRQRLIGHTRQNGHAVPGTLAPSKLRPSSPNSAEIIANSYWQRLPIGRSGPSRGAGFPAVLQPETWGYASTPICWADITEIARYRSQIAWLAHRPPT